MRPFRCQSGNSSATKNILELRTSQTVKENTTTAFGTGRFSRTSRCAAKCINVRMADENVLCDDVIVTQQLHFGVRYCSSVIPVELALFPFNVQCRFRVASTCTANEMRIRPRSALVPVLGRKFAFKSTRPSISATNHRRRRYRSIQDPNGSMFFRFDRCLPVEGTLKVVEKHPRCLPLQPQPVSWRVVHSHLP
jgi:hypothetical protein